MVRCNECEKNIEVKLEIKKYKNSVEEVYFICPYCHERYTAYFTDEEIRNTQKLIKAKRVQLNTLQGEEKEELEIGIKNLQTILEVDMNNLKIKMGR